MTHDFDPSILAIADAAPEDFAHALAKLPKATHDYADELKMAMRDAVMQAIDETTKDRSAATLEDKDLPELFACIDALSAKLTKRYFLS